MDCAVGGDIPYRDVVDVEWAIAQRETVPYVGEAAYGVWPDQFNWSVEMDAFDCDGDEYPDNGCFNTLHRRITWNIQTPNVIRHEAGHAIMWKLGHPDWRLCTEGHGR